MITIGDACVLGVVQGVTEFLPISSDGHLALLHWLIAPLPPAETLAVDVGLHAGTLVATIAYFHRDLLGLLAALGPRGTGTWERRWILLLALGSVPAACIGLLAKSAIEQTFTSMTVVGVSFLVTGLLLYATRFVRDARRGERELGALDAIVIGTFQATALLPGISRSGTTIASGLLRHLRADVAARFSFLLGIPAVLGAQVLELGELRALDADMRQAVLVGALVAGVVGLGAIWTLMRVVASRRLHYFAYYLWPLGALVLLANWGKGA
ncbi:MAG TPA: undecaprenyl-diphosphate phosphatase [Candidatus Limnocylindria bacterium]|nr:undecaprenyl-diphosphate phosphatase [Candidatus Limnocylindria bacterium]